MREIEFCMKYWQCIRCPLNDICEYFYKQEQEEKEKNQGKEEPKKSN